LTKKNSTESHRLSCPDGIFHCQTTQNDDNTNTVSIRYDDKILNDFLQYLMIDQQLNKSTANGHRWLIINFLEFANGEITKDTIRKYLSRFNNHNTYKNNLSSLKVFFRYLHHPEIIADFKFPKFVFTPKIIPNKAEIQNFFNHLETLQDKTMFLMYVSSGLRRHELMYLTMDQIDLKMRMLKPTCTGTTKFTWVSFYNTEAEEYLNQWLKVRPQNSNLLFPNAHKYLFTKIWINARTKTQCNITPQILREYFAEQMSFIGIPERYLNSFCGRTPQSVLARFYSDYSPTKLKEIYDRASISVLS
jgi:site-specific recombinase XerD